MKYLHQQTPNQKISDQLKEWSFLSSDFKIIEELTSDTEI